MATTIKINAAFLAEVMKIKSASFAHIEYVGEEKLPKSLGLGVVTKHVDAHVQLNYSYENAVNNRLTNIGEDATFTAEKLPWGKWLLPNKVIENKGQLYLRAYRYVGGKFETTYLVNGQEATDEQVKVIKGYKEAHRSDSTRQAEAGLESHQVKPFNVKAENIIRLICGECQYHKAEAEAQATIEAETTRMAN